MGLADIAGNHLMSPDLSHSMQKTKVFEPLMDNRGRIASLDGASERINWLGWCRSGFQTHVPLEYMGGMPLSAESDIGSRQPHYCARWSQHAFGAGCVLRACIDDDDGNAGEKPWSKAWLARLRWGKLVYTIA